MGDYREEIPAERYFSAGKRDVDRSMISEFIDSRH